jgi:hypothetical protein
LDGFRDTQQPMPLRQWTVGAVLTPHVLWNCSRMRANCQSPLVVPCPERRGDPDAEVGGDYRIIFCFV